MAASTNDRVGSVRVRRRRWWLPVSLILPAGLALGSWWLTEPLTDRGAPPGWVPPPPVLEEVATPEPGERSPVWPEGRTAGVRAKTVALEVLLAAAARLSRVEDYTATFRKQERIKGKLGPVQTLEMKVRHKPFAIYFKFLSPKDGSEVVYAEGHHDNKLIAHSSGVARFLVPRLAVPPDHPLALADSRHPVTEAGLANLTAKLIRFRRLDLNDPEAETVLDRTRDADGREWLRSVHTHPNHHPERPFARVEVLYDPESFFPMDIRSYDWPPPGHTGDLLLAEHYHYENLNLDAALTAQDFDPANPAYAFHRY